MGDLLAGEVFRGFVVLMRGLLAPVLARVPGDGDGHIPAIVLAIPLQTLIRGARRWRGRGLKGGAINHNDSFKPRGRAGVEGGEVWGEAAGSPSPVLFLLSWNFARENRVSLLREVGLVESVSMRASRDPWSTRFFLYCLRSVCHTR